MPDNKIRLLLVGDANSIFITNYALWLKNTKSNFETDILTLTEIKPENQVYYNRVISLSDFPSYHSFYKFKGVRRIVLHFFYAHIISKLRDYQYVHFHFISPLIYSLIGLIKQRTNSKIILTIWGSDLYRIFKIDKSLFRKSCQHADSISFTNKESLEFFKKNYNWPKPNLYECRFGLSPLENISELKLQKNECKTELGWDNNRLSVAVGYNLSKGQQHLKILEALRQNEIHTIKDKIQLVFPLGYGGSVEYKKEVLAAIGQSGFEAIIIDKYLSNREVVLLRKATDIMIQVQTTDQFSGSMQEHIFAGNVVITGNWLPYKKLKESGVYFEEVNSIAELPDKLTEIVRNYKSCELKAQHNHEPISMLSRWKNTIDSWMILYH